MIRSKAVLFLLASAFLAISGSAQSIPRVREVKYRPAVATAPASLLQTLRSFLAYVARGKPDIGSDNLTQERYLSIGLRRAMAAKVEFETSQDKAYPGEKREFPNNSSFVGAWDYPSTYSIVGSRLYNLFPIIESKRKKQAIAMIDIKYAWLKGTQYDGDESLRSFIFVFENGKWKLDDVYTFRGEFASPESLSSYFRHTY